MVNIQFRVDSTYLVDKDKIRRQLEASLRELGVEAQTQIGIGFVGERKIKELNKRFRNIDQSTDVLSFPLEEHSANEGFINFPDGKLYLGDIVICYPVAVANAAAYNKLVDDEINFLVDHGVRHLLGIHHEGD